MGEVIPIHNDRRRRNMDAAINDLSEPVRSDQEREVERDRARRRAQEVNRAIRDIAAMIVGATGAVVLLWQLTLAEPSPVGVIVAMALTLPGLLVVSRPIIARLLGGRS